MLAYSIISERTCTGLIAGYFKEKSTKFSGVMEPLSLESWRNSGSAHRVALMFLSWAKVGIVIVTPSTIRDYAPVTLKAVHMASIRIFGDFQLLIRIPFQTLQYVFSLDGSADDVKSSIMRALFVVAFYLLWTVASLDIA
jgi:hypothetical protein